MISLLYVHQKLHSWMAGSIMIVTWVLSIANSVWAFWLSRRCKKAIQWFVKWGRDWFLKLIFSTLVDFKGMYRSISEAAIMLTCKAPQCPSMPFPREIMPITFPSIQNTEKEASINLNNCNLGGFLSHLWMGPRMVCLALPPLILNRKQNIASLNNR